MNWKILDAGLGSATEHMERDRELLRTLENRSILHFYEWEGDAATHGHFVDPNKYLKGGHGLDLARRPTGGGIVFHSFDFAFSVLVPAGHEGFSTNTLANYQWVNRQIQAVIEKLFPVQCELLRDEQGERYNFCMAKPTVYDIVVENRKIGGAAQRKTRKGYLHQGTIALTLPPDTFLNRVLEPAIADAMRKATYPLVKPDEITEARRALKEEIRRELTC